MAGQSELVLTHYRAYDPQLGRWLSADPLGEAGGLNLYGYVGNDPTNYWDPLGLETVGGSGCSYRSDPFGHGTKADGTPVDPHIDRITKTGVKYRYDQDGTPRDNAPKIPKKDLRAFTAEQTRFNCLAYYEISKSFIYIGLIGKFMQNLPQFD